MSDALTKAMRVTADAMMMTPIPAAVKAAAGFGWGAITRIDEARKQARATQEAELKRYGIPYTDPFQWDATRRLETAKRQEASRAWIRDQEAMRMRMDATAAALPKDRGWKIPKASIATDETQVKSVPRVEEAPNVIGVGGP